jgi:hypothetical protein
VKNPNSPAIIRARHHSVSRARPLCDAQTCLVMPPRRTFLLEEFAVVTSRRPYASYCLDKGEWSPEGDYFPELDRLLMFKPEVHTAEWSVT